VLVIVQLLLDEAQVVMGFGDLGVVGPVGRLLDGQGAYGLTAWPGFSSRTGRNWPCTGSASCAHRGIQDRPV
jgi:hypothetical protein